MINTEPVEVITHKTFNIMHNYKYYKTSWCYIALKKTWHGRNKSHRNVADKTLTGVTVQFRV